MLVSVHWNALAHGRFRPGTSRLTAEGAAGRSTTATRQVVVDSAGPTPCA
jgi:hypothetical protein